MNWPGPELDLELLPPPQAFKNMSTIITEQSEAKVPTVFLTNGFPLEAVAGGRLELML